MASVEINTYLWLNADAENNKIRLSITSGGNDLACRREIISKLRSFIASDNGQLFKGRLQLYKEADKISILFKGEPLGSLSDVNFSALLNSI